MIIINIKYLYLITIYNVVLICLSQHCTRKSLVHFCPQPTNKFAQKNNLQCCLDLFGPTLHKEITSNVGPQLKDNFYEKNNSYNVVSNMLGQHCIGVFSSQCCPNTSQTTSHEKITCAMLAQSTQIYFRRKTGCLKYFWQPAF